MKECQQLGHIHPYPNPKFHTLHKSSLIQLHPATCASSETSIFVFLPGKGWSSQNIKCYTYTVTLSIALCVFPPFFQDCLAQLTAEDIWDPGDPACINMSWVNWTMRANTFVTSGWPWSFASWSLDANGTQKHIKSENFGHSWMVFGDPFPQDWWRFMKLIWWLSSAVFFDRNLRP